jgi:hypothetical protein
MTSGIYERSGKYDSVRDVEGVSQKELFLQCDTSEN